MLPMAVTTSVPPLLTIDTAGSIMSPFTTPGTRITASHMSPQVSSGTTIAASSREE